MTVDVLINEPRVVDASIDLCKWFIKDPVVFELTKNFMQANCLRADVYDIMMWQLACGCNDGLAGLTPDDTPVRNSMQQLGFDLMLEPALLDEAKQHYFYTPLANTFTFGIYSYVASGSTESKPAASDSCADAVKSEPTELAGDQAVAKHD